MCILCVIQKWSRRIATMLPWLVIPLIVLWAISQLLPPAFRFEITSPRLACVLVLLVTLFWYEVLMPKLSAWRIRRNARLRERKRFEAIEMQKLKKTATRRCRNCLTAYRDQNPGGGKFMCSYCGHISKRPVLDLPMHPVMGNSGILKELVGKGGKIMNGKGWSDNRWMCGQDWMENGNWGGGTFAGNSNYWSIGGGLFGGHDDHCLAEKSYSCIFIFAYRAVTAVFLFIVWVWRKIFRISSFRDDASADADRQGMLDNRSDNGGSGQESRGEKARRKAEEKRQARLEKELLEEEERKQREEVTRLVEERRRLRDKKMDAGKDCGKDGSPQAKARESKKEAERKRQERRKEKDKGSSKSNSDAEELEKRAGNRNYTNEKEQHSSTPNSVKTHGTEVRPGFKGADVGLHSRGNAGTRYFDRMRGTFLSSSRAFTGAGFFGKGTNASAVSRDHKPCGFIGNGQSSTHRKEIPEQVPGLSTVNGDDKSANHPVFIEPQQNTAPKKSWQQLFTRSSTGSPPPSNPNVICKPTGNHNVEVQNQPDSDHPTLTQSFDNPINFGLGNPFSLPSFSFGSSSGSSSISSISSGAMHPKVIDSSHKLLPEELEIFEDPCYVPDPISLLGPVSESLDNFQLDQGFATDHRLEKPGPVKTIAAPSVVTKPSPIQSPLSRSRVCVSEGQARDNNSNNTSDNGAWQMWNSSPLGQDGLGIVGGPVIDWHMYPEMNLPRKEDNTQSVPRKTMASLFKKDEQAIPSCYPSQNVLFGHAPIDGAFNTSLPSNVDDPWLRRTLFGPSIGQENKVLLKPEENSLQNGLICGNFNGPVSNQQFDLSAPYSWPKKDGIVKGSRDDAGNSLMGTGPHIGGLYTPSDVQSLW